MKKITLVFVLILFSLFQAEAQRLQITSFERDYRDLTASLPGKKDFNGEPCGLVRVQFAGGDMTFEGNVMEVEKTTSEYLVWMMPGSRRLKIRVPGYLPVEVDFKDDFGLEKGIQSKRTYVMVIEDSQYTNKTEPDDKMNRDKIMEMIMNYSIAFEKKEIAYCEKIFSKDASIITCKKVHNKDGNHKFVYNKMDVKNFLNTINRVFNNQDRIKLNDEILSITRHPNNYYSVRVKQNYKSSKYSDEGYLFLAINFFDELKPTIDVRAWQPIDIPEKDLLTIEDVKPYLKINSSLNSQEASNNNNYAQNTTTTTQPKVEPKPKTEPKVEEPKVEMVMVDTDIPVNNRVNSNTFAIIIANENYGQGVSKVDYARNDGEVFKEYCHKTLGLPDKNVRFVPDATYAQLFGELNWLEELCEKYKGEASVIFYYAGHGIPDEDKSSYLLPVDGNTRLLKRTCLSLNELYATLGNLPAQKVTVLMDACFSGAKRDGDMLKSGRLGVIKAKEGAVKGNTIVLSAAKGDEIAYKYDDAKHGLFTYFLLKKLKESKGSVTMGELSQYIQDQVGRYSIVEVGKSQTPNVQASDALKGTWESLHLE